VHNRPDAFASIQGEQGLGALGHPLDQQPIRQQGLPILLIALT